ncbi:MAG: hypothetical protein LLG01_15080 [Planctomycetaceae bacterium]|nr:hypothetical protein [Planctomycetaceae bacterium]
MSPQNRIALVAMTLAAAAVAGCTWPGPSPQAAAPAVVVPQNDPCAEMLHDLCGDLLAYYAAHGQLPPTLAALTKGPSEIPLACPISRRAYIYDRQGIAVQGWPGRLILYDAAAVHDGRRWGIMAEPPQEGKPMFIRVVPVPEKAVARSQ